jgi:hypothetical protein
MRNTLRILFLILLFYGTNVLCYGEIAQLEGWPKQIPYSIQSSPAVGDLDGDGELEIVICCTNGQVYALNANGSSVAGWPQSTGSAIYASPAICDLDNSPGLEVIVGSVHGNIHAWHNDGTNVTGWPKFVGPYYYSSPAIADLDGDGTMEVVATGYDGFVYAWHHNGTAVAGYWPQHIGGVLHATPALEDIDGNGTKEVVIATNSGLVYVWNYDGTIVTGWPQEIVGDRVLFSSPTIGNLDGKPGLEIIMCGLYEGGVYAWHNDGTIVTGWPKSAGGNIHSSSVMADLDGDGKCEVIVGEFSSNIYAWHSDGNPVSGWPKQVGSYYSSPAIADLDGQPGLELVVCGTNGKVNAWHGDGTDVAGWPEQQLGGIYASPAIADINQDGTLEVVVAFYNGMVSVYDLPDNSNDKTPWPMFRQGADRTGFYNPPPCKEPVVIFTGVTTEVKQNYRLMLDIIAEDPEGLPLTFSAEGLPEGARLDGSMLLWIPTAQQIGDHYLKITASDGEKASELNIGIIVTRGMPRPQVWKSWSYNYGSISYITLQGENYGWDKGLVSAKLNDQPIVPTYATDNYLYIYVPSTVGTYGYLEVDVAGEKSNKFYVDLGNNGGGYY